MCQNLSTPPGASHERCPHGYYVHARRLQSPRCRTCDPMAARLEKGEVSYSLALLALKRVRERLRTGKGQFVAEACVKPGWYRCWGCKEVYPLDQKHFRRDHSRANGFQRRCKGCDNRLKTARRRGDPRPGVQVLLDVGVVL